MAPLTEPDQKALTFLRTRVASFGLFAGGFDLFFWLTRCVGSSWQEVISPGSWTHLASALCLLLAWAFLRRGELSARVVRIAESAALLGSTAFLIAMGRSLGHQLERPEFTTLLGLAFITCSRAMYVPSAGRQTLKLSLVIGAVYLPSVYLAYCDADVSLFIPIDPSLAGVSAQQLATGITFSVGMWWTLFSGLAVATSKVIYGLRKEANATRRLGQYQLESEVGAGGMGVVYQARHALLRRPTAIKLLPPNKAGEAVVQRFEREVKLTARLRHPNTIIIYDYGRTPDGIFYYAMELLDGATLQQVVDAGGPLPPSRVGHILRQAAGALAEAHGLGLIHRDIKPSNIMLCNQGGQADMTKVLDFGLVKDISRAEGAVDTQANLTQANSLTGTPLYMAPEAIKNPERVDARSDLYALGAVGYYLLTGTHVFSGESVIEICSSHLHETPAPISSRRSGALSSRLEKLIMACLAKSPEDRPADAQHFMAELATCDLPAWQDSEAQGWWEGHAPALQDRSAQRDTSRTVMVDLERRGT